MEKETMRYKNIKEAVAIFIENDYSSKKECGYFENLRFTIKEQNATLRLIDCLFCNEFDFSKNDIIYLGEKISYSEREIAFLKKVFSELVEMDII